MCDTRIQVDTISYEITMNTLAIYSGFGSSDFEIRGSRLPAYIQPNNFILMICHNPNVSVEIYFPKLQFT
jgi:hypothetical protein